MDNNLRAEAIRLFILSAVCFLFIVLATGCGSTRDTTTKTVEKVETITGPLVIDTPFGQFTAQPVRHQSARSEMTVETEKKVLDLPDAGAVIGAAAGGTPWGGIIATGAGLLAAFAGKRAVDATRQRNELIDGVERARDTLPDGAWHELTKHLEAEQNSDTKKVVKERTA